MPNLDVAKMEAYKREKKTQLKGTENLIELGGFIGETIENQIMCLYTPEVGEIAEKYCPLGPGFWEVAEAVEMMTRNVSRYTKMNYYAQNREYVNYIIALENEKGVENEVPVDEFHGDESKDEMDDSYIDPDDEFQELFSEDCDDLNDVFDDAYEEEFAEIDDYDDIDDYETDQDDCISDIEFLDSEEYAADTNENWQEKSNELLKTLSDKDFRQWLLEQSARCELEKIQAHDDFWKNISIPRKKKNIMFELNTLEEKILGLLYGLNGEKSMQPHEIAALPEFNCHPFYILSVRDSAERLLNTYDLSAVQLKQAYEPETNK